MRTRRMAQCVIDSIADNLLWSLICRYCHNNPRNIDRIRKAFNKKALAWYAEQKKEAR
jgi:hypothetical protein